MFSATHAFALSPAHPTDLARITGHKLLATSPIPSETAGCQLSAVTCPCLLFFHINPRSALASPLFLTDSSKTREGGGHATLRPRYFSPVQVLTLFSDLHETLISCFKPVHNTSLPAPLGVDRGAGTNPYCGVAQRGELDWLCVALVATRNPLNIGAAARAMSNFGFSRLRVVNPYDPSFREARSAVGASALIAKAEEFKTVAEAVADCTLVVGTTSVGPRKPEQPVHGLEEGARLIRKRLASSRVALLFGSEKVGLSNEDLSHCHWLLRIPTRPEHRSMNLGQAVAVSLYEIARTRSARPTHAKPKHKSADAGQLERIVSTLLDGLAIAGYAHLNAKPLTEEKLRRLVRRLELSAADSEVLLGMLRQIVWKLHAEKNTRS